MKTYKKIIEAPRLVISYDLYPESPRKDTNIGYFVTCDTRHNSPDENESIREIIQDTSDVANVDEHMEAIKKRIKADTGETVVYISPVTKYEHGSVAYSLGTKHGFDSSNNGFYIVTKETLKECGTKKKDIVPCITAEIETYNKYVNGEIYSFILYDENGNIEDSCSGFYDIEDIRFRLPVDMREEDLTEYMK